MQQRLNDIMLELRGDRTRARREEPTPPSINQRVRHAMSGQWGVTSAPTRTQRDAYRYAGEAFTVLLVDLRRLVEVDLVALEEKLEAIGAPWTPGRRIPDWQIE